MNQETDKMNFEEVVQQHYKKVFRTAMGFVHIKEDAEDLTQEVFIRAYKSRGTFRGEAQLSTWLYRITVNLALSYVSTNNRKGLFRLGEELLNHLLGRISSGSDPQADMEREETDRLISQAIDSLPDKQRTAFVLSRYDELPQREVAMIMSLSEGAVEQLLIRAKTNLQKKIGKAIGKRNK